MALSFLNSGDAFYVCSIYCGVQFAPNCRLLIIKISALKTACRISRKWETALSVMRLPALCFDGLYFFG